MKKKLYGPLVELELRPNGPVVNVIMSGVVGFEDGPQKSVSFMIAADGFVSQWASRFNRVRTRNPDMTDDQVTNLVIHRWFVEHASQGTEGWRMLSEGKWTTEEA
jgi:hypothetical protein